MNWEWVFKNKIDTVVFMKVDDMQLDSHLTADEWIKEDSNYYPDYCETMRKKHSDYTFRSFDDVIEYVKKNRDNITPIQVIIEKDGKIVPHQGKHRWCAAKKLGIKYIPCLLQRRI